MNCKNLMDKWDICPGELIRSMLKLSKSFTPTSVGDFAVLDLLCSGDIGENKNTPENRGIKIRANKVVINNE